MQFDMRAAEECEAVICAYWELLLADPGQTAIDACPWGRLPSAPVSQIIRRRLVATMEECAGQIMAAGRVTHPHEVQDALREVLGWSGYLRINCLIGVIAAYTRKRLEDEGWRLQ